MKRFIFLLGFIVTITILGGCATSAIQVYPGNQVQIQEEEISKPDIGVVTTASVGESMVTFFKSRIIPTLRLKNTVVHQGSFNGFTNIFTVNSGELYISSEGNGGRFFAAKDGVSIKAPLVQPHYVNGGIFVSDSEMIQPKIYFKNNYNSNVYTEDLSDKINYTIVNKKELIPEGYETEENKKDSLKRELVYTGISGNTVSILYREYINNLARPAFTQEIKYDLKTSKIIGFKTARFEIIKADNASITYKTLSHL